MDLGLPPVAILEDGVYKQKALRLTVFTGTAAANDEARNETRTRDPFLTMEVLYQLSYLGGTAKTTGVLDLA